jgi:hypothetical protein
VHPAPYSEAEAFETLALQAVWVRLHAQRDGSRALCTLAGHRLPDGQLTVPCRELGINALARRGEW